MTQPLVDPPPQRPPLPEEFKTSHAVHLLLTLLTFGLWIPAWVAVGAWAESLRRKEQRRYAADMQKYESAYADWWTDYHQAYGRPPPV